MEVVVMVVVAVGGLSSHYTEDNAVISIFKHFGGRRFHVICNPSMFAAPKTNNAAC